MKMKRIILLVFTPIIITSCQTAKLRQGNYISTCLIYGKPEAELIIGTNNYFRYNFAYGSENIEGNWKILDNTLILYSDKFTEERDTYYIIKYTNLDSLDKYLIRGKRLYVINKEGVQKYCY
ncbi:MAG: hypothetical protein EAZ55_00105, partial [Cytophagales bacterium]